MIKFEAQTQKLKIDILSKIATFAFEGKRIDQQIINQIVLDLCPGPKAKYYGDLETERTIITKIISILLDSKNENIIHVIKEACNRCPDDGYFISKSCQGCVAHKCQCACPKQAITIGHDGKALIDKSKCINCGLCAKACPFNAIINRQRPCLSACAIKTMGMDQGKYAQINKNNCVNCGACLNACPFDAIIDSSQIVDVINLLVNKVKNQKVYAIIAPAIASQIPGVSISQFAAAIKGLGFDVVAEAAIGADMVATNESKELVEKKLLTSSCCPAFVKYVKKFHPSLINNISHNLSPMAALGQYICSQNPNAVCVFIGPCTAKKMESQWETVKKYVPFSLTFVELIAMLQAKNIDLFKAQSTDLYTGSYFGRIFARCGGLSEAVVQALKEQNINDFVVNGVACSGLNECARVVTEIEQKKSDKNFVEGMCCVGGCIGGAGSLTHNAATKFSINIAAKTSDSQTIKQSLEKNVKK